MTGALVEVCWWPVGVHKEDLSGVNNRCEGQMWSGTAFRWVLLVGERG